MKPSGQQQVAGFAPKEGYGLGCLDRGPQPRPGRAVDPARQVDREDRRPARVHRLDHRAGRAFDRTREPRPENGVDDEAGVRKPGWRCRFDRAAESPGRLGRIAAQAILAQKAQEPHAEPTLAEQARGDKAVAAVVARAGHDRDRGPERLAQRSGIGDRAPRILHEKNPGRAGGDREPIGFRHFLVAQELDHRRGAGAEFFEPRP